MNTEQGFPKNVHITLEHLPTGKVWKSDVEKVYTQNELDEMKAICEVMTNTSAINVSMKINKISVYFPVGVLQNSIINFFVKP